MCVCELVRLRLRYGVVDEIRVDVAATDEQKRTFVELKLFSIDFASSFRLEIISVSKLCSAKFQAFKKSSHVDAHCES